MEHVGHHSPRVWFVSIIVCCLLSKGHNGNFCVIILDAHNQENSHRLWNNENNLQLQPCDDDEMVICNKSRDVKDITNPVCVMQAATGSTELITAVWNQRDPERAFSFNATIVSALTAKRQICYITSSEPT